MCTISKRKKSVFEDVLRGSFPQKVSQKSYLHARGRAESQSVLNNKKKAVRCLRNIEWEFLLSLIYLRVKPFYTYFATWLRPPPSLDYSLLSSPCSLSVPSFTSQPYLLKKVCSFDLMKRKKDLTVALAGKRVPDGFTWEAE